jgi:ABC-type nitrate/sulfonate/bicarbonate transport system substrate-binding protein
VIIASPKLIKENPAAVKAFLAAFTKGAKEVIANPAAAIEHVKARDGIINVSWKPAACSWPSTPSSTAPTRAPKALARPSTRPPGADGLAGVGRLQHQDPRQRRRGVERQLPAQPRPN